MFKKYGFYQLLLPSEFIFCLNRRLTFYPDDEKKLVHSPVPKAAQLDTFAPE